MINWNDLNFKEKLACISLFPEHAKQDDNWEIRLEACESLRKYTEQAEQDDYWFIRLSSYRALGFEEQALNDDEKIIKDEARLYFKIKNKLKIKDKSDDQETVTITKEEYEKLKNYLGE